jgi:MFS family permease
MTRQRLFFLAYGVSIFGTGLVYPLTAIFLREVVRLDAGEVATYFALAALSGVVVNPLAGTWCDRRGPYRVAVVAVTAQAAGPIALAAAGPSTSGLIWVAAVLIGIGSGMFFAVQTPLIANLFGKEAIGQVYSRQYMIMNVATGVAGVLAGWAVGEWGSAAYRIAFGYNGLTFLVYGAVVLGAIAWRTGFPRLPADPSEDGAAPPSRAWRPYLDVRFLPLIVMQLIISGFGFAQMDAVLPVVFREVGDLPVITVGVFLTVNSVAVVLLQGPISRLCERWGNVRSLRAMFLIWAVSFLVGAASMVGWESLPVRVTLVLLFAVVFAVGECFLSPSFQPLVVQRSPGHALGSYAAAVSLVYSLGMAIGPAVMLPLFDNRTAYWAGLLAAMAVGLAALYWSTASASAPTPAPAQSPVAVP